MAGEFAVDKERLGQVAQSLLELKKMARSIENSAEAFVPLTDDESIVRALQATMAHAAAIAGQMSNLYQMIAKEALRA